jgi:hypothetical protein
MSGSKEQRAAKKWLRKLLARSNRNVDKGREEDGDFLKVPGFCIPQHHSGAVWHNKSYARDASIY